MKNDNDEFVIRTDEEAVSAAFPGFHGHKKINDEPIIVEMLSNCHPPKHKCNIIIGNIGDQSIFDLIDGTERHYLSRSSGDGIPIVTIIGDIRITNMTDRSLPHIYAAMLVSRDGVLCIVDKQSIKDRMKACECDYCKQLLQIVYTSDGDDNDPLCNLIIS